MKGVEYRGVTSVDGPIVIVQRTENIFFNETVYDAITVEKCVEARNVPGGPSKEYIASLIELNDNYLKTI